MPTLCKSDIAGVIDHSLLRPEMTPAEVEAGCHVAMECCSASICCKPCDVKMCRLVLGSSPVRLSTVVGFPHGAVSTRSKVAEAEEAVAEGCSELDMVLNIGWLKSGDLDAEVQEDIRAVCEVAAKGGAIVKVILENALLTDEQKVRGCRLAESAGAAFVKTSTGFSSSGSTPADLRLMRATVAPQVRVKGAGGIRTLDAVLEAMACGAVRVGATATVAILAEFDARTAASGGLLIVGEQVGGSKLFERGDSSGY